MSRCTGAPVKTIPPRTVMMIISYSAIIVRCNAPFWLIDGRLPLLPYAVGRYMTAGPQVYLTSVALADPRCFREKGPKRLRGLVKRSRRWTPPPWVQEQSRATGRRTERRSHIGYHMGSHSVRPIPATSQRWRPRQIKGGTRFSDPGGMQGWVGLVGLLDTSKSAIPTRRP